MKNKQEFSREHALFLKKCKRHTLVVWAFRVGILALLLGLWELIAALEWVNPFITSSPSRIGKTIGSLYADGSLFYHIGITLSETLIGF